MISRFFVYSCAIIFMTNFQHITSKTEASTFAPSYTTYKAVKGKTTRININASDLMGQPKTVSCNTTQKLSNEYQNCITELTLWKNKKKLVVEDNSEIVQKLKMEINVLFEANSDMESDFQAELNILTQQLENLKRRNNSLQSTHDELKVQVTNLVNTNNDLKRESDLYLSKNKQIRASMEIIEKNNMTLKTSCEEEEDTTIIIGHHPDDRFS